MLFPFHRQLWIFLPLLTSCCAAVVAGWLALISWYNSKDPPKLLEDQFRKPMWRCIEDYDWLVSLSSWWHVYACSSPHHIIHLSWPPIWSVSLGDVYRYGYSATLHAFTSSRKSGTQLQLNRIASAMSSWQSIDTESVLLQKDDNDVWEWGV